MPTAWPATAALTGLPDAVDDSVGDAVAENDTEADDEELLDGAERAALLLDHVGVGVWVRVEFAGASSETAGTEPVAACDADRVDKPLGVPVPVYVADGATVSLVDADAVTDADPDVLALIVEERVGAPELLPVADAVPVPLGVGSGVGIAEPLGDAVPVPLEVPDRVDDGVLACVRDSLELRVRVSEPVDD